MSDKFISTDLNQPTEQIYAALSAQLESAAALARVPISGFRVGAAALGASGHVWIGANQEWAGLPLNFTVHAEQAAVLNARAHGEKRLLVLAVSAAPCGYCRQFLGELGTPLTIVLNGTAKPLSAYLPDSFALDAGGTALLDAATEMPTNGDADQLAREAAALSFSPYTGSHSGVALRCSSGRVFTGSLLESAAYNPTLTALQCALTLRALAGAAHDPIETAVLAENGATPLTPLFAALLSHIAPNAAARIVTL